MTKRLARGPWRAPAWLVVTASSLSLFMASCAALQNTPAQDAAWDRWSACHSQVTGTDLDTIRTDGRISYWYVGPGDDQAMLECLRRTSQGGAVLPAPASQPRPGGGGGGA